MTRTYACSGNRHNIDTRFLRASVNSAYNFNVSVYGIFPAVVRTFGAFFNPSYPIGAWSGEENVSAGFNGISN